MRSQGNFFYTTDQLIPPLEIRFERFEENKLDNATITEKEDEDKEEQEQKRRSTVDTMSDWICYICMSPLTVC